MTPPRIKPMFLASILAVLVWANACLWLGAIDGYEDAVYFSMVTRIYFTETVGKGSDL
jgi:hypothetical protein